MNKTSSDVKTYTLTLIGLLLVMKTSAQYNGGGGHGEQVITVSALNLGTATMYAGGANDGHAVLLAASTSLAASSQYSGGANDGLASISSPGTSLASSSSYSGGADDGSGFASVSALSLAVTTMYAGGADDGFRQASTPAQSLSASGNYSGGPDDGMSSVLASLANLSAASMYAGGVNDGISALLGSALSMAPVSDMYTGGPDDGFSMLFAPAVTTVPLPISWEDFSVTRKGLDAWLHWQVSHEQNNEGFDVQRSFEGADFVKVGSVAAKGGISTLTQYEFIDPDPASVCHTASCRYAFYRIRQVYKDGRYSYSPIKRILLDAPSSLASVYPNPASGTLIIHLEGPNGRQPAYKLSLYNRIGQLVHSSQDINETDHHLDVRNYPSGIYYLLLSIDGQPSSYQVSIMH